MGLGKILGYTVLGIVGGVAAVAAAPFTGGGSIIGAATLATSLAGAGTIAAAAGTAAVAGGAGAYFAKKENEEDEAKDAKIQELALKAEKLEKGIRKALETFDGDKEYFNYIIGLTAIGLAMANVDGDILPEERQELEEFIGGIANSNYPLYVKETINNLYKDVPNLMTAMRYISKINPSNYDSVRELIELIMVSDEVKHHKEVAFMQAFEAQILQVEYKPEVIDIENKFLFEIKNRL